MSDYYDYDESAGYPKFSEIHEYPDIKNEIRKDQRQYYQQYQYPKKHKHKHKDKKTKYYQPLQVMQNPNPIQLVPKNQLYKSRGGTEYMAVPVGKPKLVPMLVPKKPQPQYQMPKPQYQIPQPQYQMAQPQYQMQYPTPPPMVPPPEPYPYPYYGAPSSPVVVLPPGYTKWGVLEDELDDLNNII